MTELHLVAAVLTAALLRVSPTTSQWTTTQLANVTNVSVCGDAFLQAFPGKTGVLLSPGYPMNYPNSVACFWSITAGDNHVVELTVVRLEMEVCRKCGCDSLAVYDGAHPNSTLLHKLCKFLDKKIYSTGQRLRLEFVSDSIGAEIGFQLNFTAIDLRTYFSLFRLARTIEFNVTVNLERERTLQTPDYPRNYTNDANISWRLDAVDGNYVINAIFVAIDIETCSEDLCTCDYVEVYDGPSDMFPRLEKLCSGVFRLPSLLSSGPSMFIRFYSDNSTTGTGFRLTYRAVHKSEIGPCGAAVLRISPGETRPLLYSSDRAPTYCHWSISTNHSYAIELKVVHVQFENWGCYECGCGVIRIYDGNLTHAVLLVKFCKTPPEKIYSTGPNMQMGVFVARDFGPASYLLNFTSVHVTSISSAAISTRPTTSSGAGVGNYFDVKLLVPLGTTNVLQTPGYPSNYNDYANYGWRLEAADPSYVIDVTFTAIDIETCGGVLCSCDYVEVFDAPSPSYTSSRLAKLCSSVSVLPKLSGTGPTMYIRFHSDGSRTGRGFNLTYSAVHYQSALRTTTTSVTYTTVPGGYSCGSTPGFLLASSIEINYIYSPGYPGNYSNNADCTWKIRAADGYVIQIVVSNVDMERCQASCGCDKVQVFDASSYGYDRKMLQFCSSLGDNNVVYSSQQYVFITFTSDMSITGKGFIIAYRAVTNDTDYYRTTVSSPGSTEEHSTTLFVGIVAAGIIGVFILIAIVILVTLLVRRHRKRVLNTYSNLTGVGAATAVHTVPPPAVHFYPQPTGAISVAEPGVVFHPQYPPSSTAFSNEAYAPDLISTLNQPEEIAQPTLVRS